VRVRYETWYGGEARPPVRYLRALWEAAEADGVRSVCDIGGGANPLLPPATVERAGIERYVVLDVSAAELAKAPESYEKVVADVTRDDLSALGGFDLVVSHAVAEHVADPAAFHRAVYRLLAPGGRAMHYVPTFYDPVFLANRVLPEALSEPLLARVQGGREADGNHGKFPAYYRWCRGPTGRQLRRLRGLGYSVDEYVGVFGHGYFGPLPRLRGLGERLAGFLQRHPAPGLTAYAWVVLSKP
jgi:SAM-dependent methyltransferase